MAARGRVAYKKKNFASKITFKGQLENDYFEASKSKNIQKQIRSISNLKFNVQEKDIDTQDNFLHAAFKSQNTQVVNRALIVLGQKDRDLINTILNDTNCEGKKPTDYINNPETWNKLENITSKKLLPPIAKSTPSPKGEQPTQQTTEQPPQEKNIQQTQTQTPTTTKTEEKTLRLNELPKGTKIIIPDDDDDDEEDDVITPVKQQVSNISAKTKTNISTPPLNEIAGLTKAKKILQRRIVNPLKNGENVTDCGFLLYSATECGKSFLLRSLAKSLDKDIIDNNTLEKLVEKALSADNTASDKEDAIAKILEKNAIQVTGVQELVSATDFAKENYKKTGKQTLIFIDEIGSMLPEVNAASSNLVTQAEQLIEDSAYKGFILVATTRRKDEISPASIRPGRFDRKIELKLPSKEERKEYIDKHLKTEIDSETYKLLVSKTSGFSYKNIDNVISELNEYQKAEKETVDKELKTYAKENDLGELSETGTTANYDSKEFKRETNLVTFKDVAGMKDVKNKFQRNLIDKLSPENLKWFKEHGNRPPINSGFLLFGPPGTGKTFIAQAVAGETKIPMYKIDTSIRDKFVGESEQKIKKLFKQLETKFEETGEYSILFIDEANDLLAKRKKELSSDSISNSSGSPDLVNLFLQYLNKAPQRGIIPIVATNYKDELDDAILDRLQTQIEIQHPDDELREAMLRKELAKLPEYTKNLTEADIKEIVLRLGGLSSRTISSILVNALDKCAEHPKHPITVKEITDSINNYAIEHDLPEINEYNKTSSYDTVIKRQNSKFPKDFSDVAGMEEIKKVFQTSLIDRLKPEALARFKNDGNRNPIQSNFLLYGPPGTGKTFLATAVAGEVGIPMYELKSSDIKSGLYGETEKKLQAIFDQLEKKFKKTGEYSILFVDEANDLFASAKDGFSGANKSLTNLFLQKTNNSAERGIIVIAATNYKDQIESAMLSRLGKQIYIPNPDKTLRQKLIESEIRKSKITQNITKENIEELTAILDNYSSRDISRLIKETINKRLTYSEKQLTVEDFKNNILEDSIKNKYSSKEQNIYINKLKTIVANLSEKEAKNVINLLVEYKEKEKKEIPEGE